MEASLGEKRAPVSPITQSTRAYLNEVVVKNEHPSRAGQPLFNEDVFDLGMQIRSCRCRDSIETKR